VDALGKVQLRNVHEECVRDRDAVGIVQRSAAWWAII